MADGRDADGYSRCYLTAGPSFRDGVDGPLASKSLVNCSIRLLHPVISHGGYLKKDSKLSKQKLAPE